MQNNTKLQYLSISEATAVTHLTPFDRLQSLTRLKLTQLPKLNEFPVTLPNLTKLTLKDNVNLRTLQLNAAKLIELDIINCPNLDTMQLPESRRLEKAVFQACNKLLFTDFYSIWPGFISRFQELPPLFLQRIVDYINNSFVDLTFIPKMKVYDIVTDYLEMLITLSQSISLSMPPHAYSASFALAHFGYDHPLVLKILIENSLVHWDVTVLAATADALIELQVKDEVTIQRILKMIDWSWSDKNKVTVAKTLSGLRVEKDRVVQKLLLLLESYEDNIREKAVWILASLQLKEERIIDALLRLLQDSHENVREASVTNLGILQVKDIRVIDQMKQLFFNDSWDIRCAVAKALHVMQVHDEELIRHLVHVLEHHSGNLWKCAAMALGVLQVKTDNVIQELLKVFKNKNWSMHMMAARALGRLQVNDASVVSALLEALGNNKQPRQQQNAAMALGELRVNDARVIHGLLNALGKIWSVRQAAAKALVSCYQKFEDALNPQFDELKRLQEEIHSPTPIYETQQRRSVDEPLTISAVTTEPVVVTVNEKFAVQPSSSLKMHGSSLQKEEITDGAINSPLGTDINQIGMLPSYQELINYMLNPECTIDNRTTRTSELIFNEGITLDEIHMNALETLLEQSEYDVCLLAGHSSIEENKIYFELDEEGSLKYTVMDLTSTVQIGRIPKAVLKYELTAPLTLDQLTSIPDILEIIANEGHIGPQIKTLTLNNVKFTKAYRILLLNEDNKVKPNAFHLRCYHDRIDYFVINPSGEKSIGTINRSALINMGLKLHEGEIISKKDVEHIAPAIFELTAKKGHTFPENQTRGYQTFLTILNNQRLLPQLESLEMQGCDLWDNNDINDLGPILSKRARFHHLNLDNNHMTEIGLCNLLQVFQQGRSKLRTLSVRFNKIEITKLSTLRNLRHQISSSLEAIMIEGNRIIEVCPPIFHQVNQSFSPNPVLLAHKNRVRALMLLLPLILEQYSKDIDNSEAFTVSTFLTMEHDDFDERAHELTLKYAAKRMTIQLPLYSEAFVAYHTLRIDGVREYLDIIRYLKGNITIANLTPEIRDTPFPRVGISDEELKKGCKRFLNYRTDQNPPENDARLKGVLATIGIFKSQKITTAPSYLFPEKKITLGKGLVYLMVKKKGLTDQHARIGYEYLTSYGQHVFKIAELLYDEKLKKLSIEFNEDPVELEIPNCRRSYLIGKLEASRQNIKKMHHAIEKDVAQAHHSATTYMTLRVGSSRNKKVLNCLTYIVNNIEEHLGIDDLMQPLDLLPSTVVERMIACEALQEEQYNRKEQIERTIDIDHSGICMRAFNLSEPDRQAFIQSGKEATEGYFIKRHLLPTQRDRDELPSLTI